MNSTHRRRNELLDSIEQKITHYYEAVPILIDFAYAMMRSPHSEVRKAAVETLDKWDKEMS